METVQSWVLGMVRLLEFEKDQLLALERIPLLEFEAVQVFGVLMGNQSRLQVSNQFL